MTSFPLRAPLFLLLIALATGAFAETVSTFCQAVEVPVDETVSERTLIGCGEGFPDNLLWHLDRADSVRGTLDGKVTRSLTGRGALIYFIDYSGILVEHEEFARPTGSNIIGGIDENGASCCKATRPHWDKPMEILVWGHSTGAASVAVGRTTGVAPDASAVAVVTRGTPPTYIETLGFIIQHAYAPGTPDVRTVIINQSGGLSIGDPHAPELDALIRRMTTGVDEAGQADPNGKRFLFVFAAGNSYPGQTTDQCGAGNEVILYPALLGPSIDGVVSVGGVDRGSRYWSGSCRGAEVAGPAPDMLVASISSNAAYRYKPSSFTSGTSWATPYVSGIAALLLEENPNRSPAELEALLKASPSRAGTTPVPVIPGTTVPEPLKKRRVTRR